MIRPSRIVGFHVENSAVGAYRFWQPFDAINARANMTCRRPRDAEIETEIPIKFSDRNDRLAIPSIEEIGSWAEVVVWQRVGALKGLSLAMGMRDSFGCTTILDIDDDLLHVEPSSNAYAGLRERDMTEDLVYTEIPEHRIVEFKDRKDGIIVQLKNKTFFVEDRGLNRRHWNEVFLKEADAVTTSTEHLAGEFRKFNPYVYVLPNSIPVERWKKASLGRPKGDGRLHLGWFGGIQHYDDLKLISGAVPIILKKYPNCVFHLPKMELDFWQEWHGSKQFIFHDMVPFQVWPEFLAGIGLDVALAPLNSAYFNLSKSNLKLLEYGALGIPTVFSPMGPYQEVIDNYRKGQEYIIGMWANGEQDWVDKISYLLDDATCREEMGKNMQRYVFQNYDQEKTSLLWEKCYEEVFNRTRNMRLRQKERLAKHG